MNVVVSGYEIPNTSRKGKGRSIIALPESYCVVDIETTGLSTNWDNIIEIGAIRYEKNEEVRSFQTLVKPPMRHDGKYVDDFIVLLTGITNSMLEDAPGIGESLLAFDDFIGDSVIIGYNVSFDINFLYDAFIKNLRKPLSNNYIDLLRFSRKLYPNMPHHTLSDMVYRFGYKNENAHRALSDVKATKHCYERMKVEALNQFGTEEAFADSFKRKYTRYDHFKASEIQGDPDKNDPTCLLYNRYCVFTGRLERLSRKEAMQIVANLGGFNEDRVSKKTNYLILGNNDYCSTIKDGKSSKQKTAEKYKLNGQDIEIIPETVFYDMIGDRAVEIYDDPVIDCFKQMFKREQQ
ncbi:MAG: ribonuclease H-like domain-containing protein [Candidatus Methanomethylophilaceae archaeon]|nr:ribonuclease H-like domain-containing protein [Candidatus Methanomethylophilaceae archaeon]